MKFGKYLASKQRPEWTTNYLDYKALKDVIKQAVDEVQSDGIEGSSPRETSLTVLRSGRVDRAEDRFFILIEKEVRCRPLELWLLSDVAYVSRAKPLSGTSSSIDCQPFLLPCLCLLVFVQAVAGQQPPKLAVTRPSLGSECRASTTEHQHEVNILHACCLGALRCLPSRPLVSTCWRPARRQSPRARASS